MAYIEFNNVVKEYGSGETVIRALDQANFSVDKGELAVILGASGAGKTTALNILGGMDTATSGEILVDEKICDDCLDASEILDKVGLGERKNNFPSQLSGGEQQRVSIARAIAKNPKLLLCDEPTGALDYNTGKQILQLLQDTCRKEKITVLVITHNLAIAPMADKVIHFKNGTVTDITRNPQPMPISQIEW